MQSKQQKAKGKGSLRKETSNKRLFTLLNDPLEGSLNDLEGRQSYPNSSDKKIPLFLLPGLPTYTAMQKSIKASRKVKKLTDPQVISCSTKALLYSKLP